MAPTPAYSRAIDRRHAAQIANIARSNTRTPHWLRPNSVSTRANATCAAGPFTSHASRYGIPPVRMTSPTHARLPWSFEKGHVMYMAAQTASTAMHVVQAIRSTLDVALRLNDFAESSLATRKSLASSNTRASGRSRNGMCKSMTHLLSDMQYALG